MTTNKEVKAQRPCTLWGWTFDSNQVISVILNHAKTKVWVYGENYKDLAFYFDTDAEGKQFEAIQAIASAQRPWLKAEGFQFMQEVVYMLLHKDGSCMIGTPYLDTHDPIFLLCDSNRNTFDKHIEFEAVVAFKPISDSQEAWDAVAGVEVWEG
jgi:hypothetical protein